MNDELIPYVPRVVLDWARVAPEARVRRIEGSAVFADVSGFTNLSERLARHGRVGAEELTRVISETFSELLDVAYRLDGSLLKFGGDALLLLFSGAGHQARACVAAAGMQAALRRTGRMRTLAGGVGLRLSVGVHSGRLLMTLAGTSHHELMLVGPDFTAVVEAEATASAGEIVVTEGVADAVDARWIGEPRGPGRLLVRAPARPAESSVPRSADPGVDAAGFVPESIRDHVLAGGSEPEHRLVTVGFLHFDGTDSIAADEGDDALAIRLDELVRVVQTETKRHGVTMLGSDVDRDGGKVILCAGAPRTFGDSEERMLRTLRAILDGVTGVRIRAGIHRGYAFAGDVGPPFRRTYTVMGDVVNTAARVMAHAAPGEVVATADVLERAQNAFDTEALPPFTAKGKREPIVAFRVLGPSTARVAVAARVPLIGRHAELDALRAALAAARAGRTGRIELVGDLGAGKSRLLEELAAEAEGVRVLRVQGEVFASGEPYAAVRPVLLDAIGLPTPDARRLRDRVARLSPSTVPWIPLLASALGVSVRATRETTSLDPESRRAMTRRASLEVLNAALAGPTLWLVDDSQWIDDASRDLLAHISRSDGHHWAFCASRRSGHPARLEWAELEIGPLPANETRELARRASAESMLPRDLDRLAGRSGGNPLFVLELVEGTSTGIDVDAIPQTVEEAVAARIDRLAPRERQVLRIASVLGATIDVRLVSRAVGGPRADDSVWSRLSEFLEPRGRMLRFRQELFRRVAYEGLPVRSRIAAHENLALELERGTKDPRRVAALLSLHFHEALRFDSSWHYSLLAARAAEGQSAHGDAAALYARALDAARHVHDADRDEMSEASLGLVRSLRAAGRFRAALEAASSARRMARGDPLRYAIACRVEAVITRELGQNEDAIRLFARGLRSLRRATGDDPDVLRTRNALRLGAAATRYAQGRVDECVRRCLAVIPDAEAAGDVASLAEAYNRLHLAYTATSDPRRDEIGRIALSESRRAGRRELEADLLNNLGMGAYYAGKWARAVQLYARAARVLERGGHVVKAAIVNANVAEILSDQGRFAEAHEQLAESLDTLNAARSAYEHAVRSHMGRLAARRGRFEEAKAILAGVLDRYRAMGASALVAETGARLAEAHVLAGDFDAATEVLAGADSAPRTLRPLLERLQGEVALARGDSVEAAARLDTSLQSAREQGSSHEEAATLLAQARVMPARRAELEARAARIYRRLGVVVSE